MIQQHPVHSGIPEKPHALRWFLAYVVVSFICAEMAIRAMLP